MAKKDEAAASQDAQAPADDELSADPRARFERALEAKRSRGGHGGPGTQDAQRSGSGTSARAGGKRQFRRKSG